MPIRITHRDFAALAGGLLVSPKAMAQPDTPLVTRAIPSSDERIPAVGLGTAYVFDNDDKTTRSKADAVIKGAIGANRAPILSWGKSTPASIARRQPRRSPFVTSRAAQCPAQEASGSARLVRPHVIEDQPPFPTEQQKF
jgi:hypothetical protein